MVTFYRTETVKKEASFEEFNNTNLKRAHCSVAMHCYLKETSSNDLRLLGSLGHTIFQAGFPFSNLETVQNLQHFGLNS